MTIYLHVAPSTGRHNSYIFFLHWQHNWHTSRQIAWKSGGNARSRRK